MTSPNIRVRGIITPLPSGYILGRISPGTGDTELIDVSTLGQELVSSGSVGPPSSAPGITALTGDVTATGPGSVPATLANTGVTAGSYTFVTLTVDAKGRITVVANGVANAPNGMLPLVTGDVTPGVGPFPIADPSGQYIGVPL